MEKSYQKWWVLVSMCLITVMLAIDATALNIAIPIISHEFHASLSNMQWVINAFFLLAAMVQILGGYLGDSYGHKKIFLISTLIFVLSSAGAGFSTNETMLIFFRALQGASVGIASPLTMVLIFEAFPKETQSYARSFVVATMGIALAAGAPLGGLFVNTIGWRWIFYINIPIGLLCFFLALKYCKHSKREPEVFDIKGTLFLIIALFFITFSINEVQNLGINSPLFISLFLIGIVSIWLLYLVERKQKDKIVDFHLLKNRRFLLNSLLRVINQIIFLGLLFFLPLYLQNVAAKNAIVSGSTMLTLTLVMCIISPFVGRWIDRDGEKLGNIVSMILFIVGSFLLFFLQPLPNFYLLCTALFIFGIGIGIMYTSTTTGALSVATEKKLGNVSGFFFTIAWIACALGVSFAGTAIAYSSKTHLQKSVHAESPQIERAAQGLVPLSTIEDSAIQKEAATGFMKGVHTNAWIFLILSIVGLILSLFQRSTKGVTKESVKKVEAGL